jgi:predicted CXXCH cytochrome family protein
MKKRMPFDIWTGISAWRLLAGVCLLVVLPGGAHRVEAQPPRPAANGCVTCHAAQTNPRLATPAVLFTQPNVHRENGIACVDCHGGDARSAEARVAHAPAKGFKDPESRVSVCGTCHAVFAQKFAASVHQPIFDKGCVECHGNHAVVAPSDQMLSAAAGGACAACHTAGDASDKGAVAADVLRAGIERLKTGIEDSGSLIQRIRNAGIEVSNEQLALREAGTKLTLARTEMHGFDVARVEAIVADGMKVVASVESAGQKGAAELRFRRRGLAASLGAILLFVVALGLKIRQIDRRDRARGATPAG